MKDFIYDAEEKLSNGNTIYYRVKNGTYYEVAIHLGKENKTEVYKNVTDKLINVLESYRNNKCRVRLWYCGEDGKAWNEEYDVCGRIERSCGNIKIPLIIYSRKNFGGPALSVGCIGRIDDIEDKKTIWQSDNFRLPLYTMKHKEKTENGSKYDFYVYADGEHIASFTTENQAKRWIDFMSGKSYRK